MTPPKKPGLPSTTSTSAPNAVPGTGPGAPPGPGGRDGRAQVQDLAQRLKRDPLPLLYLLGFVVLGGTLAYLYSHPATPPEAQQAAVRVDGLQGQVQALQANVSKLEAGGTNGSGPSANLAPLEARIAALEGRAAPNLQPLEARIAALEGRPSPNLQPLEARIATLEAKPPPPPFDPAPLTSRLDALAAKQTADLATLGAKQAADLAALGATAAALDGRIAAVDAQAKQTAGQIGAVSDRAGRVTRMQAALTALATGQPLGDIPGAPPSVTRFATAAPPTEAALRRSFDAAADAAQQAGQPAIMENRSFADRLVARAQQAVTVRQGDRVLVGDPLAGRLIRARAALDAGDLAAAVNALDGLAGPAQAAMADWTGQARTLLDARAALASMAARG